MSLPNTLAYKYLRNIPDRVFLQLQYFHRLKRLINFRSPQGLNEKIQWLKLYYRDPLLIQCADKAKVRDYVKDTIGEKYLIPKLGVYHDAEDIPFEALPDQFIIKATHASGWNLLCTSKEDLDISAARAQISCWLSSNFYHVGREWAYDHIPPAVLIERLITSDSGNIPDDYKFFTFHGEPKFVQVCGDRGGIQRRDLFTPDWERIPCEYGYPNMLSPIPPPTYLQKMLDISRRLAQPFPFVRVDLYNLHGKIYFGELTFYPAKGAIKCKPSLYDRHFGAYLHLERIPQNFSL